MFICVLVFIHCKTEEYYLFKFACCLSSFSQILFLLFNYSIFNNNAFYLQEPFKVT